MTSSTKSTARPDWDETWLSVARTIARRSLCSRDQVGAVVVSATNRLLETGYNGPPSGYVTMDQPCSTWCPRAARAQIATEDGHKQRMHPTYDDCPALHAEANALMRGDRVAREGGTIYVTSHVCMGCAKLIANSGLVRVFVDSSITDPVWRSPGLVYKFLDRCGIDIYVA